MKLPERGQLSGAAEPGQKAIRYSRRTGNLPSSEGGPTHKGSLHGHGRPYESWNLRLRCSRRWARRPVEARIPGDTKPKGARDTTTRSASELSRLGLYRAINDSTSGADAGSDLGHGLQAD